MGGGLAIIRPGDYKCRMKTVTRAKPKTKLTPLMKTKAVAAKPSRRRKPDVKNLAWLFEETLPPADQLPPNPVLVMRGKA
jgi:hypothetical protein